MGKKTLNILLATKMIKNRPLCLLLPKLSANRRNFDETKCMAFLIKDDEMLEKYNDV